MRILVTGTAGRVGSQVARELLDHGYAVRGLDKKPPAKDLMGRIETVYADLTDRFALLRATEGCEAVAHLAAVPHPLVDDTSVLFPANVLGTQYLLEAARANGIERFALASTCCAFGIYFAHRQIDPQYLPMDERHPSLPQDLYGLSKLLNEETAAAYTRSCGMTTACLRLTTVLNLERSAQADHAGWARRQLTRDDDRRNDLWSYIDLHDAARAFRLAVENAPAGTHTTAIIAGRDSYTACDIRDLVHRHFPAFTYAVAGLAPDASLYDTRLAEERFGFVAERQWRNFPALAEAMP